MCTLIQSSVVVIKPMTLKSCLIPMKYLFFVSIDSIGLLQGLSIHLSSKPLPYAPVVFLLSSQQIFSDF